MSANRTLSELDLADLATLAEAHPQPAQSIGAWQDCAPAIAAKMSGIVQPLKTAQTDEIEHEWAKIVASNYNRLPLQNNGETMPFVKGQSGNPNGRPSVGASVASLVRATVDPELLIKGLVDLVHNSDVPANLRIVAARELL